MWRMAFTPQAVAGIKWDNKISEHHSNRCLTEVQSMLVYIHCVFFLLFYFYSREERQPNCQSKEFLNVYHLWGRLQC